MCIPPKNWPVRLGGSEHTLRFLPRKLVLAETPRRASMELIPAQDRINRTAWRTRSARHWYGSANDWTDPGEAAAVAWVADEVRDQPLLDVGVGGGRTVPFLTRISSDYTAVDYTPELVEICRRNHPGVRVHHMDARNMAAFSDNTFALVTFSFNGIDSV